MLKETGKSVSFFLSFKVISEKGRWKSFFYSQVSVLHAWLLLNNNFSGCVKYCLSCACQIWISLFLWQLQRWILLLNSFVQNSRSLTKGGFHNYVQVTFKIWANGIKLLHPNSTLGQKGLHDHHHSFLPEETPEVAHAPCAVDSTSSRSDFSTPMGPLCFSLSRPLTLMSESACRGFKGCSTRWADNHFLLESRCLLFASCILTMKDGIMMWKDVSLLFITVMRNIVQGSSQLQDHAKLYTRLCSKRYRLP